MSITIWFSERTALFSGLSPFPIANKGFGRRCLLPLSLTHLSALLSSVAFLHFLNLVFVWSEAKDLDGDLYCLFLSLRSFLALYPPNLKASAQ